MGNCKDNSVSKENDNKPNTSVVYSGDVTIKYKFRGTEIKKDYKNNGTIELFRVMAMVMCGYDLHNFSPNYIDIVDATNSNQSILVRKLVISSKTYSNSSYESGGNLIPQFSANIVSTFTGADIASATLNSGHTYKIFMYYNTTKLAEVGIDYEDVYAVVGGYQGIISWKMSFGNSNGGGQ